MSFRLLTNRDRNNSTISGGQQDYLVGKSGSPQIYGVQIYGVQIYGVQIYGVQICVDPNLSKTHGNKNKFEN